MSDPVTIVMKRIETLQSTLEHASMEADLSLGFYAEAIDGYALADNTESTIRDIARDEGRAIVTIELGGVLGTDDGFRSWGTVSLASPELTQ